jgi:hypothetical protein
MENLIPDQRSSEKMRILESKGKMSTYMKRKKKRTRKRRRSGTPKPSGTILEEVSMDVLSI